MKSMKIAVVGAGFSGAVVARELSRNVRNVVDVFESRSHVGGHCATTRDPKTGVMVHTYGPHIFHTANARVENYMQQFGPFVPYRHTVKAISKKEAYSLPINLHTINQFYGVTLNPTNAREFFARCAASAADALPAGPANFEEQAVASVGRSLYEAFLEGYTWKQWGRDPRELPASIIKRLPVRFNYNDSYFDHPFQAIPRDGYSSVIARMLDCGGVRLYLNSLFSRSQASDYDHVFYSGPLDAWFGYSHGRLPYRTLNFEITRHDGDYQGTPVVNYCDRDVPYTRITEFKHFTPWETHDKTIIAKEFSRECGPDDEPYYPVRLRGQEMLNDYIQLAEEESNVTFVGRLGKFTYIDMDVAIAQALETVDKFRCELDRK